MGLWTNNKLCTREKKQQVGSRFPVQNHIHIQKQAGGVSPAEPSLFLRSCIRTVKTPSTTTSARECAEKCQKLRGPSVSSVEGKTERKGARKNQPS